MEARLPLEDIRPDETLYVISDILALIKAYRAQGVRISADDILDALLAHVTPAGTLLIPAFNWDFCKGLPFDIRKTPSQTGALGNAALRRSDFVRTQHPIYSFFVAGRDAAYYAAKENKNAFGKGSVFDNLHQKKARAYVIGLPMTDALTFIHHVEQIVTVPYRYEKDFTAPYTDAAGKTEDKTYSMYVRDLEKDPRYLDDYTPLEALLADAHAVISHRVLGVDFHILDLEKTFPVIAKDITDNASRLLYTYHGQKNA